VINFKQIDSVKQQGRPILQDSKLPSIEGVVNMLTRFRFVVSHGEGLSGRVWSSGQSESIADATAQSESYWLRNQLARAFDLSAGLGVPIIENRRVLAVLVFFQLVNQQSIGVTD
jgi:signal transduction protein with GAF and PtsI domain